MCTASKSGLSLQKQSHSSQTFPTVTTIFLQVWLDEYKTYYYERINNQLVRGFDLFSLNHRIKFGNTVKVGYNIPHSAPKSVRYNEVFYTGNAL